MKKSIVLILICYSLVTIQKNWVLLQEYVFKKQDIHQQKEVTYHKVDFSFLRKHFNWVTPKLYKYIIKYSELRQISPILICSIIQYESNGRNVISKKNRNKSRDYGYMQINSCHVESNPRQLLNIDTNIRIGSWYIKKCLKKSKGNIQEAVRMYNAGLNSKRKKYKNWAYVYRITNKYNSILQKGDFFYAYL